MRLWTAVAISGAFRFRYHFSAWALKRRFVCLESLEIKRTFQGVKMGRLSLLFAPFCLLVFVVCM